MEIEKLIKRIEEIFEDKLSEKTNWGKNQVLLIFKDSVNQALLESLRKPT